MSTSADINPDIIGAGNVSKAALKEQLQHLKNILEDVEDATGWQKLSETVVTTPVGNVKLVLPNGYNRYRVEFSEVRGISNSTGLFMRGSIDGGVNYLASSTPYSQIGYEAVLGAVSPLSGAANELGLANSTSSAGYGAWGELEFTPSRRNGYMDVNYANSTLALVKRSSAFQIANPANINALVFLFAAESPLMAIGSRFAVMARL